MECWTQEGAGRRQNQKGGMLEAQGRTWVTVGPVVGQQLQRLWGEGGGASVACRASVFSTFFKFFAVKGVVKKRRPFGSSEEVPAASVTCDVQTPALDTAPPTF